MMTGTTVLRLEASPAPGFARQIAAMLAGELAQVANSLQQATATDARVVVEARDGWTRLHGSFLSPVAVTCATCGALRRTIHLTLTSEGSTEDAVVVLYSITVRHRCLPHTEASMLALIFEETTR